jgi:hypothetical protein
MKITIDIDEQDAAAILADNWKSHYAHDDLVEAIEQLAQTAAQQRRNAFGVCGRVRQIRAEIEESAHAHP